MIPEVSSEIEYLFDIEIVLAGVLPFSNIWLLLGVAIFSAMANKFRLHQLSKVEKFVMSYGGLRGAVAFALVLLIDPKIVPLQPMFMTTTIAVVYFTVFIQGISIKPLVKILNVKTAEKRKPTMNERIHERVSQGPISSDSESNILLITAYGPHNGWY